MMEVTVVKTGLTPYVRIENLAGAIPRDFHSSQTIETNIFQRVKLPFWSLENDENGFGCVKEERTFYM